MKLSKPLLVGPEKLADEEDALVEKALICIPRPQKKGKEAVVLRQDELAALEQKVRMQMEAAAQSARKKNEVANEGRKIKKKDDLPDCYSLFSALLQRVKCPNKCDRPRTDYKKHGETCRCASSESNLSNSSLCTIKFKV